MRSRNCRVAIAGESDAKKGVKFDEPSRHANGKPAITKLASAISVMLTIAMLVQLDRRIPPSSSNVVATTAPMANGTIQSS